MSTTPPPGCRPWSRGLGRPTNLRHLGFDIADVPPAATLATARPYPNPRPVDHDGIVELLTHATEGTMIRGGPSATTPVPAVTHPSEEQR